MQLNAENLFLLSDQPLTVEDTQKPESQWQRLSTSIFENKPIIKCKAIAAIIQTEKPDLVMLNEVGGLESLNNFNRLFLNEQYSPVLIEGNSDRHIDIGFLVRKNIGFYFDLISNKNRPINFLYRHERANYDLPTEGQKSGKPIHSHKFSRDAAELHFFVKDRSMPFAIFVLTHLKSRLDPDNVDPNGFERRKAELETLVELYLELETRYQSKVPIAVAGDFNGNASRKNTDQEFVSLYQKTQLDDVCELAKLSDEKRATYYQVGRNKPDGRQIDFCFLSPQLAQYLDHSSVKVFRYIDHQGLLMDPPSTLDTKMSLPSDHYPILFELKNIPIF